MAKPSNLKILPQGTNIGPANDLMGIVSCRHGKYYASLVPMCDGGPLTVAIMGPYRTERQADNTAEKWIRLNEKLAKRKQAMKLVNMTTIPPDVRVYITSCISEAIREHGAGEEGKSSSEHSTHE
jgi:hypothetical protein